MANYKEIKGFKIPSLASDRDNAASEGEIWYNTDAGDFKTIIGIGSWSAGGNLNQARNAAAAGGTQTAAIFFGGLEPPPSAKAETYDGSSWTEVGDLNTARYATAGDGTSTASICFAGYTGTAYTGVAETWNGSAWTEV